MKFPNIIVNQNEEYITMPAIKAFVKLHGISVPREAETSSRKKEEYIRAISAFADISDENREIVSDWIDKVIKEGIKEVQILNLAIGKEIDLLFSDPESAEQYIKQYVNTLIQHLTGNEYDNNYRLVRADIVAGSHGRYASFLFCRMVRYHETKTGKSSIVEYPVFADYYYESGWMIIRYKSRSALFDNIPLEASLEELLKRPVSINDEIKKIRGYLNNILRFDSLDTKSASAIMRAKFYEVLNRYTSTPQEIQTVLEENQANIEALTNSLIQLCRLPAPYQNKVSTDITNLVEKYLSITWPNKDIFIKDRDAYPTRLSTTDEEESKIDQTSATIDDPLQSKEVFFDNKRMLYNQKRCDGLTLIWKRKNRTYYSTGSFPVRFSEKGGICTLSFKQYVVEEDIENVLFSIIYA